MSTCFILCGIFWFLGPLHPRSSEELVNQWCCMHNYQLQKVLLFFNLYIFFVIWPKCCINWLNNNIFTSTSVLRTVSTRDRTTVKQCRKVYLSCGSMANNISFLLILLQIITSNSPFCLQVRCCLMHCQTEIK